MTDQQPARLTADLQGLLRQVEQMQDAVSTQQRALLNARDQTVKAVALRNSGDTTRQLVSLHDSLQGLSRALRAQERERTQLVALQAVGAAINSSLNLDEVLRQVMDAIILLTRAERAMLLLRNDQGELEVRIARNIDQKTLDDAASSEISRSIVSSVAHDGVPIATLNAQEDDRFSAMESIVSYKLRSILCVPLRTKGKVTGVIYADNRIASGIFDDADRDLLAAFADQAAVAIENARLFQEVAEMKVLMDNVFASIASGVITIDEADRIALYNQAAERILGVPADSALFQIYHSALKHLGLPIQPLVREVKADGATRSAELDVAIGERVEPTTLSLTLSPLRTVQQEKLGGVAVVINDVSEKKRVESLRRYLPPALVDRVRDMDGVQRPQRRLITVLFADLRNFSALGERLEPEELIKLVNSFFSEAVGAISRHQGLIDKFMGDAVMALFNTPLNPQASHAEQAMRAALAIKDNVIGLRRAMPGDKTLHFGIGINCGEAVVGNVGSDLRKDYSAIGDVVNLAKRLQEIARYDEIIISEEMYRQVQTTADVEPLSPVQIKGRQSPVQVYNLLGLRNGH